MAQVIWTPEARKDLERLYVFLSQKNLSVANRCVEAVEHACYELSGLPRMGKPMADETARREWFVVFGNSAYVLRYRLNAKGDIVIIRVWHSREQRL